MARSFVEKRIGIVGLGLIGGSFARAYAAAGWDVYASNRTRSTVELAMIETINTSMNMIVIFVSHNMADVARLSDRVLVMDKGRIAMQGTPREVFSHEEELSSIGLGVPPVRDILKKIREAVPGFESDALTTDEAAEDIRRYFDLNR